MSINTNQTKDRIRRVLHIIDEHLNRMQDHDDQDILKKCEWELLWFLKNGRSFYDLKRRKFPTAIEANTAARLWFSGITPEMAETNIILDLKPDIILFKELSHWISIPVKAS